MSLLIVIKTKIMKNQTEIIAELKELVNILSDGKIGYKDAIDHVNSKDLKMQFLEFSIERHEMANALKNIISSLGVESSNQDGGVLGAIHRVWMEVKEVFSSNEEEAILNAIETGENAAIEKYQNALKDLDVKLSVYQVLDNQLTTIKSDLETIKALKVIYQN